EVTLLDAATGRAKARRKVGAAFGPPVLALAFAPDGKALAAGAGRVLKLWDVERVLAGAPGVDPKDVPKQENPGPDEKGRQYFRHVTNVAALHVRDGGKALLTATEGGEVARWDVARGRRASSTLLPGGEQGLGNMAAPADGKVVALAYHGGMVTAFDLDA